MPLSKICPACGVKFTTPKRPPDKVQQYCSRACRDVAKNGTASYMCRECGSVFDDDASAKRKYCSRACMDAFNKYRIEGSAVYIELTTRKREFVTETVVDASDLERIRSWGARVAPAWVKKRGEYRAVVRLEGKLYPLPRLLTDAPPDKGVDHINGDVLDNRRSVNLRLVTKAQNMQNRAGATRESASGVRNVYFNKRDGNWIVKLQVNKRSLVIGRFDKLEDAEQAAIEARQEYMPYSAR